jgi:outer membrane usher protein
MVGAIHISLGLMAALAPSAYASATDSAQPDAPAATANRLNPTKRAIILTVPAKDGATYLGDMPLTIGADETLAFPTVRTLQLLADVLTPAALESLRQSIAGKAQIGPGDLAAAGVQVTYDPRTLELQFQIPVEKRSMRRLSVAPLDRSRLGSMVQPQAFSAYLNIRAATNIVEQNAKTGVNEPVILLNGATRIGRLVGETDAIWSPGDHGGTFQRLGSRLVYDDMADLIRFTAGDLQPQSRGYQAAPYIAGLSLFRSYSVLNPEQIVRPRGDRTFLLERTSTVEVSVNGQQIRRLQLAPGNYNLRDFPFAQGGNDIRLSVVDDTGRSQVLTFNTFIDQTQLARGLSEFGLYAGVKAPLDLNGPAYSHDWIASGFYRLGVSDALTLGGNAQADSQIQMAGLEAMLSTSLGTFGSQIAYSRTTGFGDGVAVQASFQRLIQHSSGQTDTLRLYAEHRSHRFAPVTFTLPDNPYVYEVGGGYTHAFTPTIYAGIDARFSKGRWSTPDVHSYRLTGGWRLSSAATLNAEARYTQDYTSKGFSGFLTLILRLDKYSSLRSEYDTRDNLTRASFQTLHGSGVGSYNVTTDIERSNRSADVAINANYFSDRAELGLGHIGIFNNNFGHSTIQQTTLRLGTSIAMAGGVVSIGRPIYDSFAIVKPHPSLGEADVVVEPTPYGYAANSGALHAATMPGLSSYSQRTIPVDVRNAPPGTDIGQGSYKIFPAYRSGYLLKVGSDYHITALGMMRDADGQPVALVPGTATELAHPDRPPITLFTNRLGNFGVTGLAPGKWRLDMLDEKQSTYVIDIPKTAKGILRLGQITPDGRV